MRVHICKCLIVISWYTSGVSWMRRWRRTRWWQRDVKSGIILNEVSDDACVVWTDDIFIFAFWHIACLSFLINDSLLCLSCCDMICSHKNVVWISDAVVHHHTVLCSAVTSWHVPMPAFVILVIFRCHTIACCWSEYPQRKWIKFKSCVTSKIASTHKFLEFKDVSNTKYK
jgi:hypothetical protein